MLDLYQRTRRAASLDRNFASAERRAATEHRLCAAFDRHQSARDRETSATERHEASFDPLTGAYNRAAGFEELRRDVARARRTNSSLTLAFLDVDGLKVINDTDGHAAGDRALMSLVQALRDHLRAQDLIIRFGGDEFVCALASIDEAAVNARLDLVQHALAQAVDQVHFTAGLATLGAKESLEDLLDRADTAFYATRKRR